ncbi:DNA translocase FtsK 4TM domain-containing protein [bacterium]|nr:DNA translocase FtsK 4TM domain-containing protein [bacterium]
MSSRKKVKNKKTKTGFLKRIVMSFSDLGDLYLSIVRTRIFRESFGIFLLALSVFMIISFATFRQVEGIQISRCGKIGTGSIKFLFLYLGYISLLIPAIIAVKGIILFRQRKIKNQLIRLMGIILLFISTTSFVSLLFLNQQVWNGFSFYSGGKTGLFISSPINDLLGEFGSGILFVSFVLISILILTDISYHLILSSLHRIFRNLWNNSRQFMNEWMVSLSERRKSRKLMKAELAAIKQEELRKSIQEDSLQKNNSEDFLYEESPEESFSDTAPGIK